MAFVEYKAAQESHTSSRVLDVLDSMHAFPYVLSQFKKLHTHDRQSAEHTLRVTLVYVDASLKIGLNGTLAGISGLLHDTGKLQIPRMFLQSKHPTPEMILAMRIPHMDALRPVLRGIPSDEMNPALKRSIQTIDMAHHEIVAGTNGRSPYPRHGSVQVNVNDRRRMPSAQERAMQVLLAFADTTDRIAYGFTNDQRPTADEVFIRLQQSINDSIYTFSSVEKTSYMYAIYHSAIALTPSIIQQSKHILGIGQ